jgi:hypothetical protein
MAKRFNTLKEISEVFPYSSLGVGVMEKKTLEVSQEEYDWYKKKIKASIEIFERDFKDNKGKGLALAQNRGKLFYKAVLLVVK